jgi:hypothetical protein
MQTILKSPTDTKEEQIYIDMLPLIKGVLANCQMTQIMELLEQTLSHPAVVIDMGFKIIDETPSINDDHRHHVRNDVMLEEACIDLIRTNHIFKNIYTRSYASVLIPHQKFGNFMVTSIKVTNNDVMMLITFENGNAFETEDYERVKWASQILAVQYQKIEFAFNRDALCLPNHFITSLLNGEVVSKNELISGLNNAPWASYDKLHILIIDEMSVSALFALRAFLPEIDYITYNSKLISFINPAQLEDIYRTRRKEFEQFLEANHLCCAIGGEYYDIMDSRKEYICVSNILQIARNYHVTLAYLPDMKDYMLHDLIRSRYDIEDFLHPIIHILAQYDERNHTNFLETLEVYLANKNDPDLAAKQLYIHRSTLFYRVKKIREITGYNLEGMDETADIYYSLRLYKIGMV